MYKLRNIRPPPPPPGPRPPPDPYNNSDFDPHHYDIPNDRNPYQAQITASFNISNAASMSISLLLLILLRDKLPSAHARIKIALMAVFLLFLTNTFFTLANTDGGKTPYDSEMLITQFHRVTSLLPRAVCLNGKQFIQHFNF